MESEEGKSASEAGESDKEEQETSNLAFGEDEPKLSGEGSTEQEQEEETDHLALEKAATPSSAP